jgi:hypothetical protein
VKVLRAGDLLDSPTPLPCVGGRLLIGVRKQEVRTGSAVPPTGARNALLKERERKRLHFAHERSAVPLVRHEPSHYVFAEPARPRRQDAVDRAVAELVEEAWRNERRLPCPRRYGGVDKDES